ncbi:acyltransferase [Methylobacterium sp. P1-11]|nr:acyltransferase [Methylobacterium sp. P1-11]
MRAASLFMADVKICFQKIFLVNRIFQPIGLCDIGRSSEGSRMKNENRNGGLVVSGASEHYHSMDFMRGVAAFSVVLTHVSHRLDIAWFANRAYLAVDFFFVLSGFVMCSAYKASLQSGTMPYRKYYVTRLIRVFPLIFLGTIIAALIEVARPGVANRSAHIVDISVAFLFGAAALPVKLNGDLEQTAFPLNLPVWSLFFEIIANLLFPIWVNAKHKKTILCACVLIGSAVMTAGTYRYGDANRGYYPVDLWFGLARVMYSFPIGIFLYEIRDRSRPVNFFVPSFLLLMVVSTYYKGPGSFLVDVAAILVVMPMIVFISIKASYNAFERWASDWSGNLSFPIYALHYPFTRLISIMNKHVSLSLTEKFVIEGVFLLLMSALSYCAYRLYDAPLRRKLTQIYRKYSGRV